MIFEICAIIATLILIILTIYIVQTLKEIQKSLKNVRETFLDLEQELMVVRVDLNKLLGESTKLVQKVNHNISNLDPLFQSVYTVGNTLNTSLHSVVEEEEELEEVKVKANLSEKILDVIDLAKIGIKLYQQLKKRK